MEECVLFGGPLDVCPASWYDKGHTKGAMGLNDLDREALAAQTDEQWLHRLIDNQKSWILRCAADTVHRYVTDSDDEWSVALLAFTEAVRDYDESRGLFRGFAALVIRRRLLDYLRAEGRHSAEIAVAPETFEGAPTGDEATGLALQVQQSVAALSAQDTALRTRRDRRHAGDPGQYGFSFFDLTACSPRADKTKRSSPRRCAPCWRTGPCWPRCAGRAHCHECSWRAASGVPRKILDRHRRYLIAAAEILDGDFPILGAYMDSSERFDYDEGSHLEIRDGVAAALRGTAWVCRPGRAVRWGHHRAAAGGDRPAPPPAEMAADCRGRRAGPLHRRGPLYLRGCGRLRLCLHRRGGILHRSCP